jgi:histidine triad (HIT) family protein
MHNKMPENCIFCQIIAGTAPADIVYRDESITAFRDNQPAAPVHILLVPNKHIPSLNHAAQDDEGLLGNMVLLARRLAEEQMISQDGYRLVINTGAKAGQTVFHLHLHLLGGRPLSGLAR